MRLNDVVADLLKIFREHLCDIDVVVDDEHPIGPIARGTCAPAVVRVAVPCDECRGRCTKASVP